MHHEVPLVREDELQLDALALAVRTGARFSIVICEPRAERAAREALVRALGEPWTLEERWLDEPERAVEELGALPEENVLAVLIARGDEVTDAINLHREKLRAVGARFLLWIGGAEAFRRWVRRAPDAYSFRDALAIVRGDEPPLELEEQGDSPAAVLARARLERAREPEEKAAAWVELVRASRRPAGEADALVSWIEALEDRDRPAFRRALAEGLYARHPSPLRFDPASARADLLRADRALEGIDGSDLDRVYILCSTPAPPGYGYDLAALRTARALAASPRLEANVSISECVTLTARGAVTEAAKLAAAATEVRSASQYNGLLAELDCARWYEAAGRWEEADRALASHARRAAEIAPALVEDFRRARASLAIRRGDLEVAARLLGDRFIDTALLENEIVLVENASRAIEGAFELLRDAARLRAPVVHLAALEQLSRAIDLAERAGEIDASTRAELDATFEAEAEIGVRSGGAEPPWYAILYGVRVAEHLAPRSLGEARAHAERAFALASSGAPILRAESGRVLASLRSRGGDQEGALELTELLVPEAQAERVLREVVELRAVAIVACARRGDPLLARALEALEHAIAEAGDRRREVEVRRRTAESLAGLGRGEVAAALLRAAYERTLELPWPEEQGRCLEALGDLEGAIAHYERWNLTLRRRIAQRRSRP